MSRKILAFDTETTDKEKTTCGLVTLSGAIIIDDVVKEYFDFRCCPQDGVTVSKGAFEVTGINIGECYTWMSTEDMMTKHFHPMLLKYVDKYSKGDKFFPLAYNGNFDLEVMAGTYRRMGDKYGFGTYQNWTLLDPVIAINSMVANGDLVVENRQLGTICKAWGIDIEAHNSLSDIQATLRVAMKTMKVAKNFTNLECELVTRNYE